MRQFRPTRTIITTLVTFFIICSLLPLVGLWRIWASNEEEVLSLIEHVQYYKDRKQETVKMSVFFKQGSDQAASYMFRSKLNIYQNLATRIEVIPHNNANSPVCVGRYVTMILSLADPHDTIQSIQEVNNRINILKTTLDTTDGIQELQTYIVVPTRHHSDGQRHTKRSLMSLALLLFFG